ncbi:44799_t:CDS:2, partial [Gigaspora margarita]
LKTAEYDLETNQDLGNHRINHETIEWILKPSGRLWKPVGGTWRDIRWSLQPCEWSLNSSGETWEAVGGACKTVDLMETLGETWKPSGGTWNPSSGTWETVEWSLKGRNLTV